MEAWVWREVLRVLALGLCSATHNVLSCTPDPFAGRYLADMWSDRHEYLGVCLEIFDLKTTACIPHLLP